jgi:hypothetical protein
MITEKKILAADYKEFPVLNKATKNWYKLFYTYFEEEAVELYQIVIEYWNFEEFLGAKSRYNAKVCFHYSNRSTAWITYKANSIEEIEEFFANLFKKSGAIAYDKWLP